MNNHEEILIFLIGLKNNYLTLESFNKSRQDKEILSFHSLEQNPLMSDYFQIIDTLRNTLEKKVHSDPRADDLEILGSLWLQEWSESSYF